MTDTRLLEQGTDEWKAARLGCVTASNITEVLSKGVGRETYKRKLVAERLTMQAGESFSNAAMEWGTAQEPFARIAYEVSSGTFVDKTGFHLHDTIAWLGASPDGLIGEDGLIEIKCPNTATHLEYWFDGEAPAKYHKQIQCQLWVTKRSWCDFVSYDPRLDINKLFVVRVERDNKLIDKMQSEANVFLAEVNDMVNKFKGN